MNLACRPPLPAVLSAVTILVLTLVGVAAAQDPPPPPPDSIPPDTLVAPADSLEEEPEPPRVLIDFPRSEGAGWGRGVWVWDEEALLASTAMTLTDLLQRIPGTVPIRSGLFALPETASAFGATAGRTDVYLDGYALDPLGASSPDLSRIALMNLRQVRVERTLDGLRIDLESVAPTDPEAYTRIEAGTGDLGSNLFRGILLLPRVFGGPLSLGMDRISTEGFFRSEPANTLTMWGKWALVRDSTGSGIEVEYRQGSTDRTQPEDFLQSESRRDIVLRGRARPLPGVTTEAFIGSSSMSPEADSLVEERTRQAGLRAAFEGGPLQLSTSVRNRSHVNLPELESEVQASLRFPGRLSLAGRVEREDWKGGQNPMSYNVRSQLGLFGGLSLVGEWTRGRRGIPFRRGENGNIVVTEREGWRVGAEFERGPLMLGGAALELETDRVPAFGLTFDTPITEPVAIYPGGRVSGWEATGRLQLPWEPLALEGYFTTWNSGRRWIYLPRRTAGAALVYRHVPLESGNLEIISRLEGRYRGSMLTAREFEGVDSVPRLTAFNFHLQINIIDVRLFLRWENFTHQLFVRDLPGRFRPGQRVFYGVKWQFSN